MPIPQIKSKVDFYFLFPFSGVADFEQLVKNFLVVLRIDSSTDGKDSPPSGAEDEQGVSFKGV